jgi:hypothetical protein
MTGTVTFFSVLFVLFEAQQQNNEMNEKTSTHTMGVLNQRQLLSMEQLCLH